MLTTRKGRAIRFPVSDVRIFKGRESTGVRGIRLAPGDEVVSMAVIRHFEATPEERAAYLKMRRAVAGAPEEEVEADEEEAESPPTVELGQARYVEMSEAEDLLLTVTEAGAGKLSSSPRLPGARPRRPGRRRDGPRDARRPARRALPGRDGRPDHARHRRRPVDPRAGRRHLLPLAQRRRGARLRHRPAASAWSRWR